MKQANVNYIQHYKAWRDRVATDRRLTSSHISLYDALFDAWNTKRFQNPFTIVREIVMFKSRIGSMKTYLKCLRELSEWGYICYEPSYDPRRASEIHLFNFDVAGDSGSDIGSARGNDIGDDIGSARGNDIGYDTGGATGSEAINKTYTNSTNNTNSLNALNHGPDNQSTICADNGNKSQPSTGSRPDGDHQRGREENKTSGGRGRAAAGDTKAGGQTKGIPGTLEEVQTYFVNTGSTALEAKKFFSHYAAVGWTTNGVPVRNWQALADKWQINAVTRAAAKPKPKHAAGHLHVDNNDSKDYGKPM